MLIQTKTEQETKKVGKDIAAQLNGGDIILLFGDLGAGKTTLTKGIAEFFKITDEITSPTFSLMNVYDINDRNGIKKIAHIDTYRLKDENELIEIGIEDYLSDVDTICIIEWPEKIMGILKNRKVKKIKITHINEQTREIVFEE